MFKYRIEIYLFFLIILLPAFAFSQNTNRSNVKEKTSALSYKAGAFIDVNVPPYAQSTFTADQLVKNVLISGGSSCGTPNVSNVTVTPNQAATDADRFFGYFNKGTTNFPFTDGIVLVTGKASEAGNSLISSALAGTISQSGDADLAAATNTIQSNQRDAVALEFDFVPNSNQITFNYIFASEEYSGTFPCSYSDAFALLIRPTAGGPYVNVAILPAGNGPVSVTNIRPNIDSNGAPLFCGAVNPTYFGGYNNSNIETNFNGRVVPLTATATVTPGVSYHFKMVLADYNDNTLDSAVFLEGGSFNLGIKIVDGNGVELPPSINVCDFAPQVLTAQVSTILGMTFQWLLNGNPIPGATSISYTATQPGVYTVQLAVPGSTCPVSASVTIVNGLSPVTNNVTLTACNTPGNATFNLTQAQPFISTTSGVTFTYYAAQADAVAGNANTIANSTAYTSAGGQTVYVRVTSGFCSKVAELQLVKAPAIVPAIAPAVPITCLTGNTTLNAANSVYSAGATFNWTASNGGTIVSGANTLTPVVSTGGTYTLTITKVYTPGATCTATASIDVAEDRTPPVLTLTASKTTICAGESVLLTASGANSYVWNGLSGTGPTQIVTPTSNTTYVINGTTLNGCAASSPAALAITVVPAIQSSLVGGFICIGDQIILDAGAGTNYTYLWNTGATTRTISVGTPGTYTVTISNGVCSKDFTAVVALAEIPEIKNVNYDNGTLTFTASNPSNGILEYSADNGLTWQTSNVFVNIPKNTLVKLKVRVKGTSCVGALDYFTFTMNNIITPNGDGRNDIIDFRGIINYKNFSAKIADRYGRMIYNSSKFTPYWDGYFQGKKLPTTSYWYQLTFEDPASKQIEVKTGWILLKNFE